MEETWAEIRLLPEQFIDVDEHRVIVMVRLEARGSASGIEVGGRSAHLWTEKDGKFLRLEVYDTKQEALRAAGAG